MKLGHNKLSPGTVSGFCVATGCFLAGDLNENFNNENKVMLERSDVKIQMSR